MAVDVISVQFHVGLLPVFITVDPIYATPPLGNRIKSELFLSLQPAVFPPIS